MSFVTSENDQPHEAVQDRRAEGPVDELLDVSAPRNLCDEHAWKDCNEIDWIYSLLGSKFKIMVLGQ